MPVRGTLSDLVAKLPLKIDDSEVLNEYACLQLAALAGVNIAQCRKVPMHEMAGRDELVATLGRDTHFLAVDRFDHGLGSAVQMEDACQLLRLMPNQKYAGREDSFASYRCSTG
ncbi:MAG: HipA domain-containing protein [Janthinobacterium lividum]